VARVALTLAITLCPRSIYAQAVTHAALNGEWTGTLVLDNSQPAVSMVFRLTDSTFAGKVYNDGTLMGDMERGTLSGNIVHFKVGRFDFTGTISSTRMTVDLIVYNGSTRRFVATKVPSLPPDTSKRTPSNSAITFQRTAIDVSRK
jgi:hypothetical protein